MPVRQIKFSKAYITEFRETFNLLDDDRMTTYVKISPMEMTINNEKNNALYESYVELSKTRSDIIFGGRLGAYKYYDMDKVVEAALESVERNL